MIKKNIEAEDKRTRDIIKRYLKNVKRIIADSNRFNPEIFEKRQFLIEEEKP